MQDSSQSQCEAASGFNMLVSLCQKLQHHWQWKKRSCQGLDKGLCCSTASIFLTSSALCSLEVPRWAQAQSSACAARHRSERSSHPQMQPCLLQLQLPANEYQKLIPIPSPCNWTVDWWHRRAVLALVLEDARLPHFCPMAIGKRLPLSQSREQVNRHHMHSGSMRPLTREGMLVSPALEAFNSV